MRAKSMRVCSSRALILAGVLVIICNPRRSVGQQNGLWVVTDGGCSVLLANVGPIPSVNWTGSCSNHRIDGTGSLTIKGGGVEEQYKGEVSNGMLNGFGVSHHSDGSSLVGHYENNVVVGSVLYEAADGSRYTGQWLNVPEGYGTKVYKNDSVYSGMWKLGMHAGAGILTFSDGSRYVGEFKEGKYDGDGTLKTIRGDVFEGGWRAGRLTGQVHVSSSNGTSYIGDAQDGKRWGVGIFSMQGGTRFEGHWQDDVPQGEGTLVYGDGTRETGMWVNGCLRSDDRMISALPSKIDCK